MTEKKGNIPKDPLKNRHFINRVLNLRSPQPGGPHSSFGTWRRFRKLPCSSTGVGGGHRYVRLLGIRTCGMWVVLRDAGLAAGEVWGYR